MKIVSLTAENIKKLKAVHIEPKDNVVMLTGKNGAGKSSVLDSILYALAGGKELPEMPIRSGESSGKITIDLGEYVVIRTFTPKGSYLEIRNKEGFKANSPQSLLDSIIGKISFDPLSFINEKDSKKQRKVLLDLIGVNLDEYDNKINILGEQRRTISKEKKRLTHEVNRIVLPAGDFPGKEISVSGLTIELQKATEHNSSIEKTKQQLEIARLNLESTAQFIDTLQNEIKEL